MEPHPKNQDSRGQAMHAFMQRIGFFELHKNKEDFEKWFQKLSFEEYKSHVERINGIFRDIPIEKRGFGKDIKIGNVVYLPPRVEDKDALLEKSLEGMKKVHGDDRALLGYVSLQKIHPFKDGNGRTARLLYTILKDSSDQMSEADFMTLFDHATKDSRDGRNFFSSTTKLEDPATIDTEITKQLLLDLLGENFLHEYIKINEITAPGYIALPDALRVLKNGEAVERIFNENSYSDFNFRSLVMIEFLKEKGLSEGYIKEDKGSKIFTVNEEKIVSILSPEDMIRIQTIHNALRSRFILKIIDVIVEPDHYLSINKETGKKERVKDLFYRK